MIEPATIVLTHPDRTASDKAESYRSADEVIRRWALGVVDGERLDLRAVVIFQDHFVWASTLSVDREDTAAKDFVQRAIQADWEFNAGVRPSWWPNTHEADRMWGMHYREDRDNGRAELARMRLDRYDLEPVVLNIVPPRLAPFAHHQVSAVVGGATRPPPARDNGAGPRQSHSAAPHLVDADARGEDA